MIQWVPPIFEGKTTWEHSLGNILILGDLVILYCSKAVGVDYPFFLPYNVLTYFPFVDLDVPLI